LTGISVLRAGVASCFSRPSCFLLDAEKARQQKRTVIWFALFVWLNQTDQMNQINKTNQFEHPAVGFLLFQR
jgi:hypothetical protein